MSYIFGSFSETRGCKVSVQYKRSHVFYMILLVAVVGLSFYTFYVDILGVNVNVISKATLFFIIKYK